MIHASSESDKKSRMILEYQAKSPSVDESSCEGSFSGGDGSLKKGPWTAAEDAILVDYIKKHGEGNWNAVQKHTGLSRCGKSCRLRWTNHLRPDLKKGAFTPDEEQLIIKLHAKMGNRWAKMAAHLPGRTDNEIKNYWNTRLKRLQRAGLPLYPSDVCFQSLNEKQSQCGSEFDSDGLDNQLFQPSSCGTADVILDNFNINQGTLSYTQPFPGISASSMLNQGLGSQNYGIIFPTINHQTSFLSFHGNASCGLPALEQFSSFERIHRPFGMFFPHDPDPGSENLAHLVDVLSGSHTLPYGNFSTSQTLPVAVKSELPSLQYPETDLSSWLTTPTPPSEAGDPLVGSPSSVSVQSDCISPRNSGLLEALLLEAQAMASAENKLSQKNSASSTMMCCDPGEGSAFDLRSMDQRDSFDPISPLGCSAASVFSAYTPPTSVSSLDESPPGKASDGLNGRSKHVEHLAHQGKETEIPPLIDRSRHDALLGSDWCQSVSEVHNAMGDAIAVFLDDLCGEYLHVPLDP